MITREFGNNFAVTDWTEELNVIPNQWGTIGQLGLFREEGVDQYTVAFDEITKDGALIVDRVRGERATAGKDATRKTRSWAIPHFPYDDSISPSDVKGKRAYGKADEEEQLAAVRARKLERIAQNHNWTLEFARSKIITTGDVYAPNGTVVLNFYTEFGITRKEVDFVFGTGTTDIIAKQEELVANALDNANGEVINEIVGLASPEFFSKLISHANVKAAYTYYASTQEPLRNRVGGGTAMHRTFTHGNVRYIEMRDKYAGTQLIPAGDCYFVPMGTDAFKTFFAPVNKFDFLGTVGERMYLFEYESPKGDKIELESETNFLNALTRPQIVGRAYSST
jgi:hypothetical protein